MLVLLCAVFGVCPVAKVQLYFSLFNDVLFLMSLRIGFYLQLLHGTVV